MVEYRNVQPSQFDDLFYYHFRLQKIRNGPINFPVGFHELYSIAFIDMGCQLLCLC